jgi:hypothetical protein
MSLRREVLPLIPNFRGEKSALPRNVAETGTSSSPVREFEVHCNREAVAIGSNSIGLFADRLLELMQQEFALFNKRVGAAWRQSIFSPFPLAS